MVKSTQNHSIRDNIQPLAEEEESEQENEDSYKNEIILILTLLASIFSLISIVGIGGIVGNYFRIFIFGTMGLLGYVFPFVLFFAVIFILSNYKNRKVLSKIFCCIGIYFILMGLFQLLFYSNTELSLIEMYFHCAETTLGGGFFGAILTMPLSSIIGVAGTCIVYLAVFLILLTFITSRFFLSALGQKGEKEIRKMHQQYQAERTEKMVIRESYGELPPRKRGPSITFDLSQDDATAGAYMKETVPIPVASVSIAGHAEEIEISPKQNSNKQEKTSSKKKKSEKKEEKTNKMQKKIEERTEAEEKKKIEEIPKKEIPIEKTFIEKETETKIEKQEQEIKEKLVKKDLKIKEPEMQEYDPPIKEGEPITRNTGEIRRELEQTLFLEQNYLPGRPSIRFVDNSMKGKYVRKVIKDSIEKTNEQEEKQVSKDPVIQEIPEQTIQNQEIEKINDIEDSRKIIENSSIETVPVMELSKEEIKEEETETKSEIYQPLLYSDNFERFTKEKKFDGSVLEGTEEDLALNIEANDRIVGYIFPPINLLAEPSAIKKGSSAEEISATTERLRQTFESFKVHVNFGNVSCGPAVTRYEIQPEQGVKVSKITNLADDIKLNLAAADIRIEAPIPGKAAIGIEVPNKETSPVILRELLEHNAFKDHKSNIAFAVGKDVSGQPIVTDIAKMPHLLIAGATGSGKSVCINTLIMSILYKANPDDVKLIMVDPKVVELSVYNGIPHLLIPVVTDPKKASAALNWAVMEMNDRYGKFAELGVRDLAGYNKKVSEAKLRAEHQAEKAIYNKLPQIVIIVDELADLMMVAPGEVEDAICRLAQMARAAGLHLVIATQRPSVNVITGVIKANVPSRIAFSVSSAVDSRTIIDGVGAEKLLGKGDMLFFPSGLPKPIRVQGAFVSDTEVSRVVEFLREQNKTHSYDTIIADKITAGAVSAGAAETTERDSYFMEAGKFIIEKDKASIGMLQRVYKIGFNRAARIMDQLADAGVVGPEEGTKPRKILMTMEEFEQYLEEYL